MDTTGSPSHGSVRTIVAAVTTITASYVFFLIFAQFAFVKILQGAGFDATTTRLAMGCMGVAGVVSSVVSGKRFRSRSRELRLGLVVGFISCASTAACALLVSGPVLLCTVSALVGVSLGILTVYLAGGLSQLLPPQRRGLWVGCGTGLGYFICNIPSIFAGTPHHQTVVAIAGCLLGAVASGCVTLRASGEMAPEGRSDGLFFGRLVLTFLALVWLDSAAFYIIQATPALNRFGWGSFTLEWQNAGIHLVAAVLAGVMLDRGRLRWILGVAYGCLAFAAACVSGAIGGMWLTHWFYAAGVSLYSTALVFAPSWAHSDSGASGPTADAHPVVNPGAVDAAPSRAGKLYAVAGWVGSALGIGMAQDLHHIPMWFVLGAGLTVFVCAIPSKWWSLFGREWRGIFLGTLLLFGAFFFKSASATRSPLAHGPVNAQTGREVYISEGCMHCHSQFVRKGTLDEEWWGPWVDPQEILKTRPALIGNRRQGPDLLNVGNRRSLAWNRLHLINPRALTPASRMPSYAYLFTADDPRGPALLEYLSVLGMDTFAERRQAIIAWQPTAGCEPVEERRRCALYQRFCAQCHGAEGKGDGPLAAQITPGAPPRNLVQGEWVFYARGSSNPVLDLARTIKFGVPGTSMPGHELLDDSEVLGLAAYVSSLKP